MNQDVKSQLIRIDQEKDRRQASITTDQEKQAHGEVRVMVPITTRWPLDCQATTWRRI